MTLRSNACCRVSSDKSEDALLREEEVHRVGGEIAAALATLHLGLAAHTRRGQRKMIDQARRRLEAFGRCLSLVATPPSGPCNCDCELQELIIAMWGGQHFDGPACYELDLESLELDGPLTSRLLLVATELIGNAFRHGIQKGGSTLRVVLRRHGDSIVLVILDDGPGFSECRPFGAGQGIRIAGELAHRGGGALFCTTDYQGAAVSIVLPIHSGIASA